MESGLDLQDDYRESKEFAVATIIPELRQATYNILAENNIELDPETAAGLGDTLTFWSTHVSLCEKLDKEYSGLGLVEQIFNMADEQADANRIKREVIAKKIMRKIKLKSLVGVSDGFEALRLYEEEIAKNEL